MTETARTLTYDELLFEYHRVSEELAQLKRLIFGQKRERFVPLANEQQLAIGLNEEAPAAHRLPPPPSPTRATRKNLPLLNSPAAIHYRHICAVKRLSLPRQKM